MRLISKLTQNSAGRLNTAFDSPPRQRLSHGNNPDTFSHYPRESIDLSTAQAWNHLTSEERAEEDLLSGNEIQDGNWYARRTLIFIGAHPGLTIQRAIQKVWAGFSWTLNPVKKPLAQAVYFISYVPVAVLGIIGMIASRRRPDFVLIGMAFLSFIAVSAIFWAHTSHRTFLDVYLMILAASVIERVWSKQL